MLARLEGLHRHPGVVADGRIDVDEIDFRVGENVVELRVTGANAKAVADMISFSTFRWQIAWTFAFGWAW